MPRSLVYLDECVRVVLAARLRLRGFDVITAHAHGMIGVSDAEQLTYATSRDWHDLQQRFIAGMRLPGYDEDDVRMALGQMPPAITRSEAP